MNYRSLSFLLRTLRFCPLFLFFLFNNAFSLKAQKFEWATCGAGTHSEAYSVAVDPNGNVYSVGYFIDTVDFDPGPGVYNLTSTLEDIFVQKLDASGNFVWAYKFGGPFNDIGRFVTTDSLGYVYVTGLFSDTADFDPGATVHNLTSNGWDDVFILKLDPAGNFVWAGNIGSDHDDAPGAITIDHSGNVYINGTFRDTADFDPGPGTYSMIASDLNVNMFILKLNSSGEFVFAKSIDGSAGINGVSCTSIALDWKNDIYSSGNFMGTLDFDPGSGTYNMTTSTEHNAFVLKLDSTGNFIWAKQIRSAPYGDSYAAMALDKTGSVYLSGPFDYTIDLDPGSGTYLITSISTVAATNSYIEKLDPSGNFVWGKHLAAYTNIQTEGICLDRSGSVYCSGFFSDMVDFDPGPGTFYMAATGASTYVERLDSNGNFQNAFKVDGTTDAQAASIAIDRKKNVYIVGIMQGTFDFDPGAGTFALSSTSPSVATSFTAKYNQRKNVVDTTTACGSYTSGIHTWTTDGTYLDTLTASDGPDSIVLLTLTVHPMPYAGSITGVDTVCAGSMVTLSATTPGGTWSVSSITFATVTGGIVSGIAPGLDTVLYTVTNAVTGCSSSVPHPIYIKDCSTPTHDEIIGLDTSPDYTVSPNPNNGSFKLSFSSARYNGSELIVTNIPGQIVEKFAVKNNQEYTLSPDLPQGLYLLHINCDDRKQIQKIVVIR